MTSKICSNYLEKPSNQDSMLTIPRYLCQSFNRDVVRSQFEMQGLQKIKCASCGTMFMSETETATTCPSCSEQSHSHHEHGGGGCGCGH